MDDFDDQTVTLADADAEPRDAPTRALPDTAPIVSTALPPPTLPAGFEFIRELGRGGMGVVYAARQVALGRIVAIKMIQCDGVEPLEYRRRFQTEAAVIAQLDHPNIVRIHEVSEVEDRLYLVLEYCGGGTLAEQLRGGEREERPPGGVVAPIWAAQMVLQLADGMGQAHARGIIHRDLKPANVLISSDQHQLKITDFGLAKVANTPLTLLGEFLGTPQYMAPEQASAQPVGAPADVYALGCILYECLTGRPPFIGHIPLEVMHQVVAREAVPVRQLAPQCPRDLETIVVKCLHKEPQRRYEHGQQLADDLRRFLTGQPIQARPVSWIERAEKACRRHPDVTALVLLFLLACAGGTLVSVYFWLQAEAAAAVAVRAEQAAHAEAQAARAAIAAQDRAVQRSEWQLYAAALERAKRYQDEGNFAGARDTLNHTRWDLRGWEYAHLESPFYRHHFAWRGEEHPMTQMAFSPDGTQLAAANGDQLVRLWDLRTGQLQAHFVGHTQPVWSLAFSPDGTQLLSGSGDEKQPGLIVVWDVASGRVLHRLPQTEAVWSVAYHPTGRWFVTGSGNTNRPGTLMVWEAQTGTPVRTWPPLIAIWSVAFSPDGTRLAAGLGSMDESGAVGLWEWPTGTPVRFCTLHRQAVLSVAFSPDGQYLASGGRDQIVHLRDAQSGEKLHAFPQLASWINCVQFSPDGTHLAVGTGNLGKQGELALLDVPQRRLRLRLPGVTHSVWGLAFHPHGTHLAVGVGKKKKASAAQLWDLRAVLAPRCFQTQAVVWQVQMSPDGQRWAAASGAEDGPGVVHLGPTGDLPQLQINGHRRTVYALAFSPDGRTVATVGGQVADGGELGLWDAHTGQPRCPLIPTAMALWSVAFTPDGQRLLTAGGTPERSGELASWSATNGALLTRQPLADTAWSVSIHPAGTHAVTAGNDQAVRLWTLPSLTLQHVWERLPNPAFSVAFSPDGTRVAAGLGNIDTTGEAWVWDVASREVVSKLYGHAHTVFSVAFSPDGTRLATGSGDLEKPGEIKLWEVNQGHELFTLRGHTNTVFSVAFSPRGDYLASTGRDGTVRWWPAEVTPRAQQIGGARVALEELAYTADGQTLVGRGLDSSGQVVVYHWDDRTGRPCAPSPSPLVGPRHPQRAERLELINGQPWRMPDELTVAHHARRTQELMQLLQRAPHWHWEQAELARHHGHTFAATFHRQQLTAFQVEGWVPRERVLRSPRGEP